MKGIVERIKEQPALALYTGESLRIEDLERTIAMRHNNMQQKQRKNIPHKTT
jgi:hypothetical protein